PFLTARVVKDWVPDYEGDLNYPESAKEEYPDLVTPEEYTAFVAGKILDGIKEAWNNRTKAKVGTGTGFADVASPDRCYFDNGDGTWYLNWSYCNPDKAKGYVNDVDGIKAVETLGFWDYNTGELLGIAAGIFTPAQTSSNDKFVSSDLWHFVREKLRDAYGIDVPLVSFTLFAGDCGPKGPLQYAGYSVARGIYEGLIEAKNNITKNPVLRHERFQIDNLPLYRATKEEYEEAAEKIRKRNEQGILDSFSNYFDYAVTGRYELQREKPTHEIFVHAVRLGKTAMGTVPFEMFMPFARELRAKLNYNQVLPIELTEQMHGYLGTERVVTYRSIKLHHSAFLLSPQA
ncbi:MAG TPA: hypothetical protein PLZ84_09515, partial [Clostridia bacterium]|nr:hypothetical protein [Clostridia bacterium]